jgi:hypothetical protein
MTVKETLSAFVCGVAAMFVLHTLFVDLDAQVVEGDALDVCVNSEGVMRAVTATATCSAGERKIRLKRPPVEKPCEKAREADLAALRNRLTALESPTDEFDPQKAVAPFEVVNEAGTVIFSVTDAKGDLPALTRIFNETGARIATVAARTGGGELTMSSPLSGSPNGGQIAGSGIEATLATWGDYSDFMVTANSSKRVEIGRVRGGGHYGLSLFGASGKPAAELGELESGSGIAVIFDTAGMPRVSLQSPSSNGPGIARVIDASGQPVALISGEGEGGTGLLLLTNNAGVPLVRAEIFPSGIGAVRTGPGAFQPGKMFIPLPLSYIEGKK